MSNINFLSFCSGMVFLFSSSGSLLSATYYVAKTGADSNPCSTSAPCLSIQRGVARAAKPGDTLIVRAGTYIESVISWNSGAPGKSITVQASPGDLVVWRGKLKDPNSLTGAISIQNNSHIRVEGFQFDGTVTRATIRVRGRGTEEDSGPSVVGIEIINNTFTNNGNNGVKTGGADSRVIYLQGTGNGASSSGPSVNVISSNSFEGNYGADIHLIGEANDTLIVNNVSSHLKSSKSTASGDFFNAKFVQLGGGSRRNLIGRNTVASILRDSYTDPANRYYASGIRLDTGAINNIISENVIHDIDFLDGGRSAGIYAESGCNNNLFQRNIVYNIGEVGLREGSLTTNVAVGNRWISNTVYNCKQSGLILINAKRAVIKNNLLVNNGISQIYVTNQSVRNGGHQFGFNNYFKVRQAEIASWNGTTVQSPPADKTLTQWTVVSGEIRALSIDPQFVNPPADFRLRSTSPARGTGEGGVDLGAYPFFQAYDLAPFHVQRSAQRFGDLPALGAITDLLRGWFESGRLETFADTAFVNHPSDFHLQSLSRSEAGWAMFEAQVSEGEGSGVSEKIWNQVTGESQPIDQSKLETIVGVLASHETHGLIIIRDDKLIAEWYAPGWGRNRRHEVGSMAKSLVGGMSLLVAASDGRIGLSDYAWRYISGWKGDEAKSGIRIWHLASDRSGIEEALGPEAWKEAFWKRIEDPFTIALREAPVLFRPGSRFDESHPAIAALGYAVTASLKGGPQRDIRTLLKERIMESIGVGEDEWQIGYRKPSRIDGMKVYATWGGASYSPRAIARVGRLMMQHGNWEGRQLVNAEWVRRMVSAGESGREVGLCWWTNRDRKWPSLPVDAFAGAGPGHQVLLVVPSLELIVVRTGNWLANGEDYWAGPEEYLFEPVIQAIR